MKFPEKGHCLINNEIVKYLENEYILHYNTVAYNDAKIVAWDNNHYWYCLNSSIKPKYEIEELLKLINPKDVGVIKLDEEEAKIATRYLTNLGFKLYSKGYNTSETFLHVYYHLKSFQFLHSKIDTTYRDLNKEDVGILEKNEKFIVGKWYKGNNDCYIKFNKLENCKSYNRVWYSEKIVEGIYSLKYDYWANIEMEEFALKNPVNLEEIQKYLPEGHIDKKSENKIPEYVKLIKGWSVNEEYMGEIFEMSTLDNLSKFKSHPSKESFRGNIIIITTLVSKYE